MDYYTRASQAPVASDLGPVAIARQRCERMDPFEQHSFMDAFAKSRIAEIRGRDSYRLWRECQWDSAAVAGYIEGVASARRKDQGYERDAR